MAEVQLKDLIEAGVHFGHQRKKWNPKMKPYIYGNKNGVCIIDLVKTSDILEKACQFLKEAATQKKNIIFVGTKKHICEIIKEEAIRCGAFYINRRWLGGLLTNFDTVRQRINRLRELEDMIESGTIEQLSKKERSVFNKELEKLQKTLGGIKNMRGKADIVYVVDQQEEDIAIKEALKTNLKIVALVDSNCDPDGIDFPIPGNDDSIRSVSIITKTIANSIIEGHDGQVPAVHASKNGTSRNVRPPARFVQEITTSSNVDESTVAILQEVQVAQENG